MLDFVVQRQDAIQVDNAGMRLAQQERQRQIDVGKIPCRET